MTTLTARIRGTMTDSARALARLRAWFDPQLALDARPLEIREAILEQVTERTEPAGHGRRVLAHNHVIVTVLAADKEARATLQATLADLESSLATRLREVRCQPPSGFRVTTRYVTRPRAGWAVGQCLAVEYDDGRAAPGSAMPGGEIPAARFTVVRGHATQQEYVSTDAVIRIGRTIASTDDRGRPRHNQIAFVEDGDEHGRTVGRAHASIRYDSARGEYRLFDDGSRNGTRVVRNGAALEVIAGDPVGVMLCSGDEIQLGTAALVVHIDKRKRAESTD